MKLENLLQWTKCNSCTLGGIRVPGEGPLDADIMLIGQAPGDNEIKWGRVFVGASGDILNMTLDKLDIPREAIYVTNMCMCQPEDDGAPTNVDVQACWPRLAMEIKAIKPRFIIALGKIATHNLFGPGSGFMNDRGVLRRLRSFRDIFGFGTYHPAALTYPTGDLKFPEYWRDMKKLKMLYQGVYREPQTNTDVVVADHLIAERAIERALQDAKTLAYDWETTGLDPRISQGFCLGMSWRPGTALVWPREVYQSYLPEITELFEAPYITFTAFNAPFDTSFNEAEGLPPRADSDPYLIHGLLDERPQSRNLERLTVEYLDWPPYETQMLRKFGVTKATMVKELPPEVLYDYCGKDCDGALRLHNLLHPMMLKESPKFHDLYHTLISPAHYMLRDISQRGISIDLDRWEDMQVMLEQESGLLRKELQLQLGEDDYNPNSHPQTQAALWDKLKLPEPILYGRDDRSSNKETLEYLMKHDPHPFVGTLKKYRDTFGLLSRYIRPLERFLDDDNRVHPTFRIFGAETGRLSAADPPIQQIPKRPEMRAMFKATEGYKMIRCDYSQAEIRVAAHYSEEPFLIQLFQDGLDFHTVMAALAKGDIPSEDLAGYIRTDEFAQRMERVTPGQRQAAKSVSFGLLYGMGDAKLALGTGLPEAESIAFVKNYKTAMPQLQRWITRTQSAVRNQRYVESINGRRRRFPFITERNLADLEREAVNMPIQSAASDLLLDSAVRIHREFNQTYPGKAYIIILVHDEIVAECEKGLETEIMAMMRGIMENPPFQTDIPFPVDFKLGDNWGYGEEIAV